MQLPDAASLERTQEVVDHIARDRAATTDGVVHTTGIAGQSFTLNANGSNFGNFFVTLDDFDERRDPSTVRRRRSPTSVTASSSTRKCPRRQVSLFTPPPVSGLGSASGFKIIIEDRGDLGLVELQKQIDSLDRKAV